MATCPNNLTVCEQAAVWLAQAKSALHALLTGSKVEALTHGDKSTRFGVADIDALRAYVRQLQDQVDTCNGTRRSGRAFRFIPDGW